MAKVTPNQILDAMELNGYKHVTGTYIEADETYDKTYGGKITQVIVGACAIGQAALNLGIWYHEVASILNSVVIDSDAEYGGLGDIIITDNDSYDLPLAKIVEHARTLLKNNPQADVPSVIFPSSDLYNKYANYQGVRVGNEETAS